MHFLLRSIRRRLLLAAVPLALAVPLAVPASSAATPITGPTADCIGEAYAYVHTSVWDYDAGHDTATDYDFFCTAG